MQTYALNSIHVHRLLNHSQMAIYIYIYIYTQEKTIVFQVYWIDLLKERKKTALM